MVIPKGFFDGEGFAGRSFNEGLADGGRRSANGKRHNLLSLVFSTLYALRSTLYALRSPLCTPLTPSRSPALLLLTVW